MEKVVDGTKWCMTEEDDPWYVIRGVCHDATATPNPQLVIQGSLFKTGTVENTTVVFNDVDSANPPTMCAIETVNAATMRATCTPDPAGDTIIMPPVPDGQVVVEATVNGETETHMGIIDFCAGTCPSAGANITTAYAKGLWSGPPTVKSILTIGLDCSFPIPLLERDLTITLEPISGSETVTREICIMNVVDDVDNKEIITVINGAWTGDYRIKVLHDTLGYVDNDDLIWSSIAQVTDITPNHGSKLGGTLLTLTGNHFSDVSPENDINLIYIGDTYCKVEARIDTEIKCRVETRNPATSQYDLVSVFMKLSE